MMATKVEILTSYGEAWNTHDPEKVAGHFAADGVREWELVMSPLIGGSTRFAGPSEIASGVKAFMDAVPDLTVDIRTVAETDDGAMMEWMVTGTHTGAWGGWTGQGEKVEFPGVSVYRIAGDKLMEERMYFDPDLMAKNWSPPKG
jgi:steroid delta-isomerase-like uncharacterized protein